MTDEERQKLCADLRRCQSSWLEGAADEIERVDHVKSMLETAAELLERLAHELVATNGRLVQLEARIEALERM
jgi:hypothetical protein